MENLLFKDLQISPEVKRAIEDMGFEEATPIQSQSLLPALEGGDLVAQAPTGTGKTFAFGIPLVEKIDTSSKFIQAIIICPTRELVVQTTNEIQKLTKYKAGVRAVPIYGGQQIDRQIFALKKKPQIIIATPGRLMDHMRRHTIRLEHVEHVVLDEADEMLNMGFREDIDTILQSVPEDRQTMLFSATLSNEIRRIVDQYEKDPTTIQVTHKEITVPTIEQLYIEVNSRRKFDVLTALIDTNHFKLAMVFCNTKRMVDELTNNLNLYGYAAEGLHGDMKQSQRDKVMTKFKKGETEILVATDVAARGIDVDNVEVVFNYDIPEDEEYYVHRIGRTGRANHKGVSYTFVSNREMYKLRNIMRYTKSKITPVKAPTVTDVETMKLKRSFDEIQEIIESGKHELYIHAIEEYLSGEDHPDFTTLDIAAALLSKSGCLTVREAAPVYEEEEDFGDKRRGRSRHADGTRLFLNIGKMDRMNRAKMAELFSHYAGLDEDALKGVEILDKFSFVTVDPALAEAAVAGFVGREYKGRRLAVEIADGRGKRKTPPYPYKGKKNDGGRFRKQRGR